MTIATIVAPIALIAIGLATPRQAERLFGSGFDSRQRGIVRLIGFCGLFLSCVATLSGPDRSRAFISLVGALGVGALLLALTMSALSAWRVGNR